ncbi:hypothetical protein CASFOL_021321 [Castilleja foliolosa]|uniref:Protein kinase domain-containing protein n=1 Tax=Castilleja foliolosa TaxID=1961234 RepID=A0ABD3CXS4_9LAMI
MTMMQWTRGATVGKGGFGFVSVAKTHQPESSGNRNIPTVIAVKSAKYSESDSLLKEKEFLDKFKGCPSILGCFGDDITTENGVKLYNILMEYASGGCLADHIVPKKGMAEIIVRRCTKSILMALVHIHRLGYIYCDVKPHNVLLNARGDAMLADFGSCLSVDDSKSSDFRGTVLYSAPESIARQKFVPESDIWALGCSVLHMLTGKSPWVFDKNTDVKDALFRIGCSSDIPEIPTSNKISKEARDFLKKCLVKDPTARWKADMLIDHPFVKSRRQHHVSSSRSSHLGIHSIVPHCFHIPKVQAC